MTYFMRQGSRFTVTNQANINIDTKLPAGTYAVNVSMDTGFFLEAIPPLQVVGKLYGDIMDRAGRILNTFLDRPSATGVLLQGDKGSGKTLLARVLSNELTKMGMITIVVNTPFSGDGFNQFIQRIDQPAMVFFDEFEKVYEPKQQQELLTLFDGTYASKKLFVATTNDNLRISDYMKNRPGRFFYLFSYKGLDEQFIKEYCQDTLNDKKQIDNVVFFASTFESFNFDMLKALVEEMNRYKESVAQASKYINATPADNSSVYIVDEFLDKKNGRELKVNKDGKSTFVSNAAALNPFKTSYPMYVELVSEKKKPVPIKGGGKSGHFASASLSKASNDYDEDDVYIYFKPDDIKEIRGGTYVLENEEAFLIMSKHVKEKKNYYEQFLV